MTNEELDEARVDEAYRQAKECPGQGQNFPLIVARLAREGWMPPEPVDPDLAEAAVFENRYYAHETIETICLQAIKRGRALAAAEAKPGLVWVKHDGSEECPVSVDQYVWVRSFGYPPHAAKARNIDWRFITHYAIIPQPEDVA